MSDLTQSLGMIFSTTADTSGDTGFFADIASLFGTSADAATGADVTGALTEGMPAEPPPTDVPTPEAPPAVQPPPVSEGQPNAGLPTGTQPPAPVDEMSTGATGQGILNSAANWFRNLTPGAQAILASGAAGGAAGLINALSQRNTLEEQRRIRDQQREDVIRRGHIDPFAEGAIKPKGGIINGAREG